MADSIGKRIDVSKALEVRQRVLDAIKIHLDRGCFEIDKNGQKSFCPYYDIEVPCETQIFLDVYDILSPKPVSNMKYDGMYLYGSCPSCGNALYHNVVMEETLRFCQYCGASIQWNAPEV